MQAETNGLPFSTRIVAKFIGTEEKAVTFKFTDADGITKRAVRMVVQQSGVSFAQIKDFAKSEGSDVSGIEKESPAAGYAFEYWLKAADKSAAESTNNYSADTTFTPKFVKQVSYTVNTGVESDKTATFELAYGEADGQYAKTIYNKAVNAASLDAPIENPTAPEATLEFSAWNISLAEGGTVKLTKDEINNTSSGKGAEKIRSGASMSPYFIKSGLTTIEYVFKTFDFATKQEMSCPVHLEVEKRSDNQYTAYWKEIKETAGKDGISIFSPVPPAGYTFKGWRENDTETLVGLQDDGNEYPANASFKIKFTKDLTYSVDKGDGHGAANVPPL